MYYLYFICIYKRVAHISLMYLTPADYTQKTVSNPLMLQPGGTVASGRYQRTRKNTPISGGLLARMKETAAIMVANCRLNDKCKPRRLTSAVIGQPVPGKPGKVYVDCTDDERVRRLQNARQCAINSLSTKGGIYGTSR